MSIQEMREQRAALVAEARKLVDVAEREGRDLSAEENARWDTINADVDKLTADIKQAESALQRRERVSNLEADLARPADQPDLRQQPGGNRPGGTVELPRELRERFASFEALHPVRRAEYLARSTPEYTREFRDYLAGGTEHRGLLAGTATQGGYLVPMGFSTNLIQALDDALWVRQRATRFPVTGGDSLGCPVLATDLGDAAWSSEVGTVSEDTALRLGLREWHPHPLAKLVKVSRKLIRTSAIPVESLISQRLTYKVGTAMENAFMTGNGVGKPLGLFVEHASGITSARTLDTATANTIAGDDLINLQQTLAQQYRSKAVWIAHRLVIKAIRKVKSAVDGQYLWQPSLQLGQPDMLLGAPIYESEYAPDNLTGSVDDAALLVYGDLSYYWIADGLNMEIQVVDQLYAATNQIGYIVRAECDAMPVLPAAFAMLTNKA